MLESQWWLEIERYALAKDSNGMLVCADGLEECGAGRMAEALRWAVRKQLRFGYVDKESGRKWYTHLWGDQYTGRNMADVLNDVQGYREVILAYYT